MRPSAIFLGAALLAACPRPVWADTHGVTVVNSGTETIRRIEIGSGDNRLRSQVPPGAQARITYSTGCKADIRIGYDGGRTEAFAGVDICADPRIVTGQGVVSVDTSSHATSPGSGKVAATKAAALGTPVKAPPPIVPPWTGKSITKRFGGME